MSADTRGWMSLREKPAQIVPVFHVIGFFGHRRSGVPTKNHFETAPFRCGGNRYSESFLSTGKAGGYLKQNKQTPSWGICLFGAGDRTRTGTSVTSRDFKSLVSTYSTTPAFLLEQYTITLFYFRQARKMSFFTPIVKNRLIRACFYVITCNQHQR